MEQIIEQLAKIDRKYQFNDDQFRVFYELTIERSKFIQYIISNPSKQANNINKLLKQYEIVLNKLISEFRTAKKPIQELVDSVFVIRIFRIFSSEYQNSIYKELSTALFDYLVCKNPENKISLADAISVGNYSKAMENIPSIHISLDKKQLIDDFRDLINVLQTAQTQPLPQNPTDLRNTLSHVKEKANAIIIATQNSAELEILRSLTQIIREPDKVENIFAKIYAEAFFNCSCKLNSKATPTDMEKLALAISSSKNKDDVSCII